MWFPWPKFLRRRVDGKHPMCFQSETSVFKFLQRRVNGRALLRVTVRNYLMTILTSLCVFWQRLTCCVSLLLSFLCVNIAWYRPKTEVRPYGQNSKPFPSFSYLGFKTSLDIQPFMRKCVFLAYLLSSKSMKCCVPGLMWKNEINSSAEMARFWTVACVYAVHGLLCKKQTSIEFNCFKQYKFKQEYRLCELISNFFTTNFIVSSRALKVIVQTIWTFPVLIFYRFQKC